MKIAELLDPLHYESLKRDVEGSGADAKVFAYWSESKGYLVKVIAAHGGVIEASAEKCTREAARAALGLLSPDTPSDADTKH